MDVMEINTHAKWIQIMEWDDVVMRLMVS